MSAARDSHKTLVDGRFARDPSRGLRKRHERAIDLLAIEGGDNPRTVQRPNPQVYIWCPRAQPLYQRDQNGENGEIGTADRESMRFVGIEPTGRRKHGARAVENIGNDWRQGAGASGGFDAFGVTHEQRVAEHDAQSTQCVARSRLRQAKPFGRTSNMALDEQLLKYDQQIQVGAWMIDFIHQVEEYYELD